MAAGFELGDQSVPRSSATTGAVDERKRHVDPRIRLDLFEGFSELRVRIRRASKCVICGEPEGARVVAVSARSPRVRRGSPVRSSSSMFLTVVTPEHQ
jgi:hypothetical protein